MPPDECHYYLGEVPGGVRLKHVPPGPWAWGTAALVSSLPGHFQEKSVTFYESNTTMRLK